MIKKPLKDDVHDRLDALENENLIAKGIAHGIKVRCAFVWSFLTVICGLAGSWASGNIDAFKAAFKAFWAVWGQKW